MTVVPYYTRLCGEEVVPGTHGFGEVNSHFRVTCDRCGVEHAYVRDEAVDVGWLSLLSVVGRNGARGPNSFGWAAVRRSQQRGNIPCDLCPKCAGQLLAWLDERQAQLRAEAAAIEAERIRSEREAQEKWEREARQREQRRHTIREQIGAHHKKAITLARDGNAQEAVLLMLEREDLVEELARLDSDEIDVPVRRRPRVDLEAARTRFAFSETTR